MPAGDTLLIGGLYLVAINLFAALCFAWDKYCAMRDMWRVPERTLLSLAAAGGSIGAITASQWLRHKTYKEPFRTNLRMILAVQVVAVVALLAVWVWRGTGGGV